ncbi:1-deoxy-D-xylulose-5-phosphate synthase [Halalkalibacterium halodurans]|jgi:1-deoxy-D-xylulose-5-phosphate synthase|uniref:1-deoxy-D-xylulose-5-phosphate synthase n=2 Tax=Halalkalibacterium halodurans TaxID=86665 RepID=DXS_HALH5|nr:1-deoxy-D-xylulose-5-phosphate synthase [Halalkalibacterium halodurans]Q9K971.1 RecName: Full=1-deoxy-D-xylulose-5-phosphate synthase; AltName: Full=1-deoxyxylulose-5-phosphate synthase; Short=DXP synthase; Short=DXPS [Halalkalibacterium halodurans C-125]MDY7223330.1 1-deoxy-D-xylulose-5-phosphate synthase [Halalkalibacterium halodurans]MDY7242551.1 1-deoxy-D-xylulose-5-phosphate synthase [Halalkalibacterium halodurans]MED3646864.1 1-deoxy-D-xylulose-5-phosphate synthase [Halalkalibacterium 
MDLEKLHDPSLIKSMTKQELEQLAEEIRQFLIEKLSITGGHLGPNLGVVELTLALHSLFDSPKDKLIWDVGHQAYVHKILTGRAGQFDQLRQYKGLCGFPKRDESEHDVWETGHSSTSLSAAMGMATARDLKGTDENVIAIIGDGALTGGMALEALNHIGHEQKDLIVVLNDNEMSIAPNVGALHNVLGRLRTAGKYQKAKEDLEMLIKKIPAFGGKLAQAAERVKDSLKYLLVSGIFFEEMGFTYLGPVDGHDLDDLMENLKYAKKTKGPVLIHVLTKKGKGYAPAENDEKGTWHGVGHYKIESGELVKKPAPPSYSGVFAETLKKIARNDPRIVALTAAMPGGTKLDQFAKEFPDRMFDVGIAEQHATTMAGGLATQGLKPVFAVYSTFLQRGYDQVVHDICRQNLNVFFAIDRAGLVGADGETHQGVFDIAYLRHLPNMKILMPKDENELQHMVYTAIQYEGGPIAVRYPRGNGYGIKMDEVLKEIPIGSWEVLQEGTDACILTFGTMIPVAEQASKELSQQGYSIRLINARSVKPLDEAMLHEIAKSGRPVLTLEETAVQGSFGSAVLEFFHDHGYHNVVTQRMGIPDRFIEHGSVSELLEEIGLTSSQVANQLSKLLPRKQKRA